MGLSRSVLADVMQAARIAAQALRAALAAIFNR